MYTNHRDDKEGDLAQGDTIKGKQEGQNRALQAFAVLVVEVGMLLTGLTDTEQTSGR